MSQVGKPWNRTISSWFTRRIRTIGYRWLPSRHSWLLKGAEVVGNASNHYADNCNFRQESLLEPKHWPLKADCAVWTSGIPQTVCTFYLWIKRWTDLHLSVLLISSIIAFNWPACSLRCPLKPIHSTCSHAHASHYRLYLVSFFFSIIILTYVWHWHGLLKLRP